MDYFTFILKHLKLETTEKQESRKCYLRSRKVNIEVCRTQKCRYLVCLKGTNTHPKKILFLTLAIAMTKNMLNRLGHEIRHFWWRVKRRMHVVLSRSKWTVDMSCQRGLWKKTFQLTLLYSSLKTITTKKLWHVQYQNIYFTENLIKFSSFKYVCYLVKEIEEQCIIV